MWNVKSKCQDCDFEIQILTSSRFRPFSIVIQPTFQFTFPGSLDGSAKKRDMSSVQRFECSSRHCELYRRRHARIARNGGGGVHGGVSAAAPTTVPPLCPPKKGSWNNIPYYTTTTTIQLYYFCNGYLNLSMHYTHNEEHRVGLL